MRFLELIAVALAILRAVVSVNNYGWPLLSFHSQLCPDKIRVAGSPPGFLTAFLDE
ncbi:hypothetical protein [Bradyrhizobium sp. CCGUVB23]|uniref:hypothetical protein n=1 Tax=Bradyrhizobium sp. CCGUVB23 TaxID=2949630 RepID=UPI0020B3A96C|nr:hypothetical protein [Bradyrhizobium sp. CCGUVB23]MCP3463102.1 hypothetical protein [Bradyrhizobium sp. CCGUVB23]